MNAPENHDIFWNIPEGKTKYIKLLLFKLNCY